MELFQIPLSVHPLEFELIPLFDIHFGTKLHRKYFWQKVVNYLKEKPYTFCYIGGDICEFITLNDKRFDFASLPNNFVSNIDRLLTYSIEYSIEKLTPIKDKILFIHAGNHDVKYLNSYGIDLIGAIAKELGIKTYTQSYEVLARFLLKCNNKTYSFTLYSHHGMGWSTKPGSLINRLEDLSASFDADIYVAGHAHSLVFTYRNFIAINNTGTRLLKKKKYFLRVGGFRDNREIGFSDYSEKFGHKPTSIGTYIIKITKTYPNLDFTVIPILE